MRVLEFNRLELNINFYFYWGSSITEKSFLKAKISV